MVSSAQEMNSDRLVQLITIHHIGAADPRYGWEPCVGQILRPSTPDITGHWTCRGFGSWKWRTGDGWSLDIEGAEGVREERVGEGPTGRW